MPGSLTDLFREAHRLRKHVRDLKSEIERGPRVLKAHQQKLAKQEQTLKDAQDALKKLKVWVHEQEVSLKATNTQIAKYEKQLNDGLDAALVAAKQKEIDFARKSASELEDAILSGMGDVDERNSAIPKLEEDVKKAKADYAEYEKGASERLARLNRDVAVAAKELADVEKGVPANVRGVYDRLVKAHDADAIAAVVDRTCQQCHTSITAQHLHELTAGQFVCCRSCGRVLYLPA